MTYVITEPCIGVKDASCVDVCPVDCIHSTDDDQQYYINPETCIDCAACETVCPVNAIFFETTPPTSGSSTSTSTPTGSRPTKSAPPSAPQETATDIGHYTRHLIVPLFLCSSVPFVPIS